MVFHEAVNVYHTEQDIDKFKENKKDQKQNNTFNRGVAEMRRLFSHFRQFQVLHRFYNSMITDFTPGNYNKDVAKKQCQI